MNPHPRQGRMPRRLRGALTLLVIVVSAMVVLLEMTTAAGATGRAMTPSPTVAGFQVATAATIDVLDHSQTRVPGPTRSAGLVAGGGRGRVSRGPLMTAPSPEPPPSPPAGPGDPNGSAGLPATDPGAAASSPGPPAGSGPGPSTAPPGFAGVVPPAARSVAGAPAAPGGLSPPSTPGSGSVGEQPGPAWWDVKAQAAAAINSWLAGVVSGALTPIAQVGGSLLDPDRITGLTQLQQLWGNSRAVANGLFGLLVLLGAVVVSTHESVQTRWALKQIGPRLALGFVAANMSWTVITAAVTFASALAVAVAGNGMAPGQILTQVLIAALSGGPIFAVILQITLLVTAAALIISLIVVGVGLMLLTVTAPLALCLHALPQTEQIAFGWWRALAATLAIPTLQGLILALLARVVLQPGGYGLLGIPSVVTGAGNLLNLIVTIALLWLMLKVPSRMWRLATGRPARGGGRVRGLVKTALGVAALAGLGGPVGAGLGAAGGGGRALRAGRTLLSLLGSAPHPQPTPTRGRPRPAAVRGRAGTGGGGVGPWARVRQTPGGQLILPLPGLRRVPPPLRNTAPATAVTQRARGPRRRGRQLALYTRNQLLGVPNLGRDGQYELPLDLTPVSPTNTASAREGGAAGGRVAPSVEATSPRRGRRGSGSAGRQLILFSRNQLLGVPGRNDGESARPPDLNHTSSVSTHRPHPRPSTPMGGGTGAGQHRLVVGQQTRLFSRAQLRDEPVLGPDGQYRLPIHLARTYRRPPPAADAVPAPSSAADPGQLALPPHVLVRTRRPDAHNPDLRRS